MDSQRLLKALEGRSAIFLAGLALVCLLFGLAIWWTLRPSYVALDRGATDAAQADILATLSQWQVPYRVNAKEGGIDVLEEQLGAARMHLAEAGIPTRADVGFELFDKADYGMSEFTQRINYQRALEGELARSVMSMRAVKFARVHLTLKKSGLYQHAGEQAKASVIVRLKPSAELNGKQVQGIQQLVASAVEGMTLEHVVVLDEAGRVLTAGDGVSAMPERIQLSARIEAELQQQAATLLRHAFGSQGAQVSVRVKLNFDRMKTVREQPIVSAVRPAILHEKQLVTTTGSTAEAQDKRSQSTREVDYMVGKEVSEIEHAMGAIERVSVGVVLAVPQSEATLKEIERLLKAALGLDTARGDQLVIAIMPVALGQQEARTASTLPTEPDATSLLPIPKRQPWLYWVPGLVSIVLLAYLLLIRRPQERPGCPEAGQSRMSAADRERLLQALQCWLREGK